MAAKIDGTNGVLQQYDYQASTTGFSYTFTAGITVLVLNPAGTLATGTVTMPATPADGMTISISSTQTITALTINGNSGQSIVGKPTTLVAGGSATFVYRLSDTTWYTQTNTAALGSAAGATGVPTLSAFTSPGTWTKPALVKAIKVTVIGGGGAGGTAAASSPTLFATVGGGGGGGGTSTAIYPAPSLPGPQPYTVGAAGATSSFGVAPATVISATAGAAGSSGGFTAAGGDGGAGSGGTINSRGGGGASAAAFAGPSPAVVTPAGIGGAGGSSSLGGGGAGRGSGPSTGNSGNAYGGGGSGGSGNGPAAGPGGAGAAGVVIVEEFY